MSDICNQLLAADVALVLVLVNVFNKYAMMPAHLPGQTLSS